MDVKDDTMKSKSNHTSNIPVPSYRGLRRSQEELEAKEEARKQRSSANAQSLAKSVLEQDLESKAAAATPPEKLRRGLGQSPPTQLQTKERTARERSAAASRVRPDPDGSRLPTTWDRENEEEDNGEDSDDVVMEDARQRQEVDFSSSPGTEIHTATTPPFAPVDASSSDEMVQYGEAVGMLAEEAVVQEPLFHTTEGPFQGTTREAVNANTEAESSILPLPSPQAPSPPNESLVEARPVPEEEEHPPEGLMEAQPVDLEQKAAQRSEHRKQFRNRAFVGGACIILAVVVAIVLWLVLRQDNPPVQVVAPADSNTSAPTFLHARLLGGLFCS
ncbi:expressed unknown protein [Seminavis robusta]|uniref:Uncharacterized protein n=1 Tax=Seminavis robusta TaxID=568900 RepID=A0A9N8HZT8_9STRA|nr:expressed unknown protein [Seminavis robusta]|eukprot:Sro4092_g352840.1 n/a (332) ;mRNA; f:1557-2552